MNTEDENWTICQVFHGGGWRKTEKVHDSDEVEDVVLPAKEVLHQETGKSAPFWRLLREQVFFALKIIACRHGDLSEQFCPNKMEREEKATEKRKCKDYHPVPEVGKLVA